MDIPLTVKHDDLMAALQPLYDLLGVTPMHVYSDPPLMIGGRDDLGAITFTVVASPDEDAEYPPAVLDSSHPQGPESCEQWRHYVTVKVV